MLSIKNLQTVFGTSPTPCLVLHPDEPHFTIAYANQAYLSAVNRRAADILEKPLSEAFPEHTSGATDITTLKRSLSYVLNAKAPHKISLYRYNLVDPESGCSESRFWTCDTYPLLDECGNVSYIVRNPADVTAFLREEAKNFTKDGLVVETNANNPLFRDYPDAVFTLDLNGNFLSVNKNLVELSECPEDQILQMTFKPFIAPEHAEMVFTRFQQAIKGEIQNYDANVITAQGNHRILNLTNIPLILNNEVVGVYVIAKDITGIRDAEKQLDEYHHRMTEILESVTDGFLALDTNWTVTYWNKEAERILLRPKELVIGSNLWQLYPEAVSLKFFSEYHRAKEENTTVEFLEYLADVGSWLDVTAYPSQDGLSVFFKDVSSRILADEQLKAANQQYHDLFNLSPFPQWVYDVQTLAFLDVNEAAMKQYGYSRQEFLTMTLKNIRPCEDLEEFGRLIKDNVMADPQSKRRVRHKKKSGEVICVEVEGTKISFEGKDARLVLVIDVTERLNYIRSIEEQNKRLQEISWLQSHVVRAPLAKVIGLSELLSYDEADTDRNELLNCLRNSANELDTIIRDIISKPT
jgi:PAS domain S-box-containing protein